MGHYGAVAIRFAAQEEVQALPDDDDWNSEDFDLDQAAAEIADAFAARLPDRRELFQAAEAQGDLRYVPMPGTRMATPEEQAVHVETQIPGMIEGVRELRSTAATRPLTSSEQSRLTALERWFEQFAPGTNIEEER